MGSHQCTAPVGRRTPTVDCMGGAAVCRHGAAPETQASWARNRQRGGRIFHMFPDWGFRIELIYGGTPKFDFAADPRRVGGGVPLGGMCPSRDRVAPRRRGRAGCSPRTGLKQPPRVGDRWIHTVHVHVRLRGVVIPGYIRVHNRRGPSARREEGPRRLHHPRRGRIPASRTQR